MLLNKENFKILNSVIRGLARRPFSPSRFGIRSGYRHRETLKYFDDTELTDEYQREVYQTAQRLAEQHNLRSVVDVGCGSAHKLMEFLGGLETTGIDVPPTLEFLRTKYPERKWVDGLDLDPSELKADMVICSDVIEHVLDPDALLQTIKSVVGAKWIVISTPERTIVRGWHDFGPPVNPCHVREWTGNEFRRYISQHFEVVAHQVTNYEQGTQMLVCRPR